MSGWRIGLWALVVLIVIGFLYLVRSILLPFIVVFVLATLLEPLVRKLRFRGFSRGQAVISVLAPFYIILISLGAFIAPRVASEVSSIQSGVSHFADTISSSGESNNFFLRWNPLYRAQESQGLGGSVDKVLAQFRVPLEKLGLPSTRAEIMHAYVTPHKAQISQGVQAGFNSFFGILGNVAHQAISLLVIFIGVPLLLMDLEGYQRNFPKWIPPSIRANTVNLLSDIGEVFVKYMRGVSTVVLIYMVVVSIVFSILNVPYSILCGVIFGVFYLIPMLGNIINYVATLLLVGLSGTTGTFFIHLSSSWVYAVVVLAIYIVIGITFDELLYPQFVGNAVGLSGVVNLFVILSGGALFGLVGMIIAFPLAGSAKIILDRMMKFATVGQDTAALPAIPLRHREDVRT